MEQFSQLFSHARLTGDVLKVLQYSLRVVSSQQRMRAVVEKLLNSCASIRRFLRIFSTLALLVKLGGIGKLGKEHLGHLVHLLFNVLDHMIIYYQKSPDTIGGLVSVLRNWVWVCNCLAQVVAGCYNTAIVRQKLQSLVWFM
jgi:hypothetical protein